MDRQRFIISSDLHFCHKEWYGVGTEARLSRCAEQMNEEYRRDPYSDVFFLGDYSLDHWAWEIRGCYLNDGTVHTADFIETVAKKLPVPYVMIPGNHEQYGDEKWMEITGFHRSFPVLRDNLLFLFWDSYGDNLDPDFHSDGTYTPLPVSWIQAEMDRHPGTYVILCSHFFKEELETEEGKQFLRDNPRIICLFAGHNHLSAVRNLTEACGNKPILFTGNYSYSGIKDDPAASMWGFRDLTVENRRLSSRYLVQESEIVIDGQPIHIEAHAQDEFEMELPSL